MSEFFASFSKTIGKLFQMQQTEPPAILLEGLAQVLRFGLVAICIAAMVFAVQLIISLCVKKQRKNAIAFGAVCLVCVLVVGWAFVPISAAPKAAADSAAVQTLSYISTKELAAQEAAAQADSETAIAANAAAPEADAATAGGTNSDTTGGADTLDSQGENDAEESLLLDDALHRVVAAQTELSDAQADEIVKLLKQTKCTRTTRMSLPQENAQNVLLRLEDGRRWQILILQDEGYVYATEKTGYLCKIDDYTSFYKQLKTIVK